MSRICAQYKYIKDIGRRVDKTFYIRMALIYFLPLLLAFHRYTEILCFIEIALMLTFVGEDEYLFCLPINIVFYQQMTIGGVSVLRLYTLVYLFRFFFFSTRDYEEYKRYFPHVIICIMFSIFVILPHELQRSIFICLDVICIWSITAEIRNKKRGKDIFKWIVYALVLSCLYGYFSRDSMLLIETVDGTVQTMTRYLGTFNDPNYAGLFYNIGIIICLTFPQCISNRTIRYCALVILLIGIIATISMTGILSLVIMLLLYCFFIHDVKKAVWLIIIVGIVSFCFVALGKMDNEGLFGQLYIRFMSKMGYLQNSDFNSFSTDRTSLAHQHWLYYWNQDNLFAMLFGGNPISAAYTDRSVIYAAAHNEYVDLLLSIGIVGWVVYMGSYIYLHMKDIFSLKKFSEKDDKNERICRVLIHFCYLIYAFTLTMFLDTRFLFLLFI